jgi:hypothetical protein
MRNSTVLIPEDNPAVIREEQGTSTAFLVTRADGNTNLVDNLCQAPQVANMDRLIPWLPTEHFALSVQRSTAATALRVTCSEVWSDFQLRHVAHLADKNSCAKQAELHAATTIHETKISDPWKGMAQRRVSSYSEAKKVRRELIIESSIAASGAHDNRDRRTVCRQNQPKAVYERTRQSIGATAMVHSASTRAPNAKDDKADRRFEDVWSNITVEDSNSAGHSRSRGKG